MLMEFALEGLKKSSDMGWNQRGKKKEWVCGTCLPQEYEKERMGMNGMDQG